ncbi:CpxP family protein [Photobacterium sp. SDRW27]|uniref:CpxP family protein n=1 Tax=Photobacterium obscurum TaxID=2829490 RepID=UPI002244E1C7|nr:CpxP family protein [Photobacterium obscurum]MCW8329602.1 CpxP family protein [Photobacterium obscurum]
MTTFKKTLLMAIALPLALGSASALAFGGNNHNGGHHGGKGYCGGGHEGRKVFKELDLTDTQKQQMKTLRQANRDTMKANFSEKRAAMQANHQQMQALMLAEDFDENAVRDLAQKMSEQQVEHRVAMMEKRHEMLNILTPEQKVKYQQLQAERAEKCEARWAEKNQ